MDGGNDGQDEIEKDLPRSNLCEPGQGEWPRRCLSTILHRSFDGNYMYYTQGMNFIALALLALEYNEVASNKQSVESLESEPEKTVMKRHLTQTAVNAVCKLIRGRLKTLYECMNRMMVKGGTSSDMLPADADEDYTQRFVTRSSRMITFYVVTAFRDHHKDKVNAKNMFRVIFGKKYEFSQISLCRALANIEECTEYGDSNEPPMVYEVEEFADKDALNKIDEIADELLKTPLYNWDDSASSCATDYTISPFALRTRFEKEATFDERIHSALVKLPRSECVVVFAHGGVLSSAIRLFYNNDLEGGRNAKIKFNNCAALVLRRTPEEVFEVEGTLGKNDVRKGAPLPVVTRVNGDGSMKTTVVLVRHGESITNACSTGDDVQCLIDAWRTPTHTWVDGLLSKKGTEQAKGFGLRLNGLINGSSGGGQASLPSVVLSPMRRCVETFLFACLNCPILKNDTPLSIEPGLQERRKTQSDDLWGFVDSGMYTALFDGRRYSEWLQDKGWRLRIGIENEDDVHINSLQRLYSQVEPTTRDCSNNDDARVPLSKQEEDLPRATKRLCKRSYVKLSGNDTPIYLTSRKDFEKLWEESAKYRRVVTVRLLSLEKGMWCKGTEKHEVTVRAVCKNGNNFQKRPLAIPEEECNLALCFVDKDETKAVFLWPIEENVIQYASFKGGVYLELGQKLNRLPSVVPIGVYSSYRSLARRLLQNSR